MLNVVIQSAVELTSSQLEKIKAAVTGKYGSDVKFSVNLNADLIGGVAVTIGSRQVDGSVKGKIDHIKKVLEERK